MSSRNLFTISVTHSSGVLEERSAELKCVCVCVYFSGKGDNRVLVGDLTIEQQCLRKQENQ